jgi:hypothetical protein
MTTHFITAEIDLTANPSDLPKQVEAVLQQQGTPLRWEIAAIDTDAQTATIEAVVTSTQVATGDPLEH